MSVSIRLLGGFDVIRDDVPVPAESWVRRQAAQLVQLLALSRDLRMHREQVTEALWPGLSWDVAGPRLHKAAHYARRALEDPGAVVLRRELVSLFPGRDVRVDVREFARAATEAVQARDGTLATEALRWYAGPLLPDDPYEAWTEEPRAAARLQHLDLLRLLRRWDDVLAEEPADEEAHLALARARADGGDARGALLQLERLEQALRGELGATPGWEAVQLRAELEQTAAPPGHPSRSTTPTDRPPPVRLFGRRNDGDRVRAVLDEAAEGRGVTLVVSGPAGIGKSAVLDLAEATARRLGWKIARSGASAVEAPWPYSPVLEALSALCRRHPALLDGLADVHRAEIEHALTGRDLGWTGENSHQRLFVATAELMRVAAAGAGLLLVIDDLHDADEASLRLLHYLSRCAVDERVVLVLAHRDPAPTRVAEVAASMVARGGGHLLELRPLATRASERLVLDRFPQLGPEAAEQVAQAGGGLPFAMLEMARARVHGSGAVASVLPPAGRRTFQRVALLGTSFGTDELLAISDASEDETYDQLEQALAALVVEPAEGGGFRFRHQLVREGLVEQLPPHERSRGHQRVAEALAALERPPGQVAHHYLAAGIASRAVPYVVRAVEVAGALGAYRDALDLVDGVRGHAGPDQLPVLLSRRADLLMALGDPGAVAAYTEAAQVTTGTRHRLNRARLARAAAIGGDLATARSALAGLDLEDDEADAPLLLAQGMVAYFSGDMATARSVATEARERLRGVDDPWHVVDLVGLHGLLAHQRGEWFASFRTELRRTQGHERLAGALFDAHLCVAENLLYGREPYPEIIAESERLRQRASQAGALRGVAFATALIGEAALMMGDLARADAELQEAIALHADIDAAGGQAHSMQRLAEVRLAQGRGAEARQLLEDALLLARWSTIGMHLLQRIFGTLIESAPDPESARSMVDRAESSLGDPDRCWFCTVMLAVPAATACARVGDLEAAHRFLTSATESVSHWGESSWQAAVVEARAAVALAEGDAERHRRLCQEAAESYAAVGHVADAARCRAAAGSPVDQH